MTMLANHDFDLTETDFRQISDVVYRYCGINLHDGKMDLVRARMAKQLRVGGFRSTAEYLQRVRADDSGAELVSLIDAISTNLTSLFREPAHFRHLREKFLPGLLERKRRNGPFRIRAWSAGCSSGEEAYSLAMVLDDTLGDVAVCDTKILATDISTRMLQKARSGVYPQEQLRTVPHAMLNRYFVRQSEGTRARQHDYAVEPALRRLISFRRLNLMDQPWPFSGNFDFIFCRNVMIYFDQPTQERLVQRYWEKLESGGLLFTGHAESLAGVSHRFHHVEPTIYEKR
jgi:chemotaxis protein methyltransferase CheR